MIRLLLGIALTVIISGCENQKNRQEMQENSKTPGWAHSTNIYEVNVRQYTAEGTFNAFAREMPRLREMGVETLWLMPITPIAQKNKKGTMGSPYACADYTAINPEFGTLDDFKKLVKEAQQLGFKVIIDWVANHTGWDHVWTVSNPEYYLKDTATNDFQIASGMDDIIELDYSNPELRKKMIEAMQFWVREANIDGFRCDLASWVELDFWQEARPRVDSLKHLFWLGEFDELENPGYGEVFDASYTWTWMHKTREFYEQQLPVSVLDSLLYRYSAIGDGSMRAWFTTNHDENSWNGSEYEKYGDMAKTLAVFSATWNGVPLLYSGQELPNKKRLEFFEKDAIAWNGQYELHDFYKTLLQLKTTHPALRAGDTTVTTYRIKTDQDDKIFAYLRKKGEKEVLVALNLSRQSPVTFRLQGSEADGEFTDVFNRQNKHISATKEYSLNAWEYWVLEK